MTNAPAPSFGKRNSPAAPSSREDRRVSARPAPPAGVGRDRESAEPGNVQVPRSFAAGLMAATVSGVLHTVVVLHVSTSAGGSGFDVVAVGDGSVPSLPLVLLGSLWAGGESGLSSVFVVHRVLSWLGRPGFLDYAIGGGLAAAVLAAAGSALGWSGPDDGWAAELAAGALAGTVYRVFAGASRHD